MEDDTSMIVHYDPHARKRMRERRVTEMNVEEVLRNYEVELPAKLGRRNRYKVIAGTRIRVTFDAAAPDEYYVWTVTSDEVVVKS
jgi:Domain of unknown function (DUF4258)